MSYSLSFVIPSSELDLWQFYVWQWPGVGGLQESPVDANLFSPNKEFSHLEPVNEKNKAYTLWLDQENFKIQEDSLLLKVYFEQKPSTGDLAEMQTFLESKNLEFFWEEHLAKDYLKLYQDSLKGELLVNDLWVGPSWAEVPQQAKAQIIIEPGQGFGTGDHPTTQMCLEALFDSSQDSSFSPKTIFDLGFGSGVLTVGARKFFPSAKLFASDIDPRCLDEWKKNAELNGVPNPEAVEVCVGEGPQKALMATLVHRVDLVVANIYAEVLVALMPQIKSVLKPVSGECFLSGILKGPSEDGLLEAIACDFEITHRTERKDNSASQNTWVFYRLKHI